MTPIATNYTPLNYEFKVELKHIWIVSATVTTAPWHHLRCKVRLPSQVMSRGLSGKSGRYNSYMLRFYTKFVVQRCIVCCDRRHLDKSTSDYIRNTGTRGGRIFVTLVTSTPEQMYVILLIYQYLYISEQQIFSRLSMHNIKITAASQPTHSKPSAIFKLLWRQPNLASQVMSRGLSG